MILKPAARKKERFFLQGAVLSITGIILLYAFCICWFISFIEGDQAVQFYTPAVPALLSVLYALTLAGLPELRIRKRTP